MHYIRTRFRRVRNKLSDVRHCLFHTMMTGVKFSRNAVLQRHAHLIYLQIQLDKVKAINMSRLAGKVSIAKVGE